MPLECRCGAKFGALCPPGTLCYDCNEVRRKAERFVVGRNDVEGRENQIRVATEDEAVALIAKVEQLDPVGVYEGEYYIDDMEAN